MSSTAWPSHEGVLAFSAPALALGLAGSLANFEITAVIIALPDMARSLGLDVAGYAWVIDAYSLAFTGALLLAGAWADRYGRRKALLAGNALFALASLACGMSGDGPTLWAARALQGVGAAFMVTGSIALVVTTYPDAGTRSRTFAWLGVMTGAAMALGPTTGGLISSLVGWRWIFFVNLPVCALMAVVVPRVVSEARDPSRSSLDLLGIALVTAALGALIEALLHGRGSAWRMAAGCVASCSLLSILVVQQRRRVRPLLDPGLLLQPALAGVSILLAAVSISYWAVLVHLPILLGRAYGLAASEVGLAVLAATGPMLVLPPLGGWISRRLGWRGLFAASLALIAIGDASLATALLAGTGAPNVVIITLGLVTIGSGAALAHPQLSGAMVALARPEEAGMVSALTIVMRQAGFATGVALLSVSMGSTGAAADLVLPLAVAVLAAIIGVMTAVATLPGPQAR